jgi:hypothetical protein
MKKLILLSTLFICSLNITAQLLPVHFCFGNINCYTDSLTGSPYAIMPINITHNNTSLDSINTQSILGLVAITTNTQTIRLDDYWNYNEIILDTIINIRVDTCLNISNIKSVTFKLGMPACGVWWYDSITVNNNCNANYYNPLGLAKTKTNNNLALQIIQNQLIASNSLETIRHIKILSINGQIIMEHNFANNHLIETINFTTISAGHYIVIVNNKYAKMFQKD